MQHKYKKKYKYNKNVAQVYKYNKNVYNYNKNVYKYNKNVYKYNKYFYLTNNGQIKIIDTGEVRTRASNAQWISNPSP